MSKRPYMPLMMGDWVTGTRGMRADVKGVYIGLLIHQYDHGYLPADLETLSLIEPEVGKVWVFLKDKFFEFEPGKLQNQKLEDVRNFWGKQALNGQKGGRPKKENPNNNPNHNPNLKPNNNPNHNHHIDIDIDYEINLKNEFEEKFEKAFDEITMDRYKMIFTKCDLKQELIEFKLKCLNASSDYFYRDLSGLRNGFQSQLKNCKTNKSKVDGKLNHQDELHKLYLSSQYTDPS